ncbi:hypothetical protein AMECASPLE_019702 [Ameca splendens]|uniref:Uncharacterized protein n=1 Tax=Ameca splendens TaxID=208324 RepID=A0ABV0ZCU4_9TELE
MSWIPLQFISWFQGIYKDPSCPLWTSFQLVASWLLTLSASSISDPCSPSTVLPMQEPTPGAVLTGPQSPHRKVCTVLSIQEHTPCTGLTIPLDQTHFIEAALHLRSQAPPSSPWWFIYSPPIFGVSLDDQLTNNIIRE